MDDLQKEVQLIGKICKLLSLALTYFFEVTQVRFGGLMDQTLFSQSFKFIPELFLLLLLPTDNFLQLLIHTLPLLLEGSSLVIQHILQTFEIVLENAHSVSE